MRYQIKFRCDELEIPMNVLRKELEYRQQKNISPSRFSGLIHGNFRSPDAEADLRVADAILTEWKEQRKNEQR